MRDHLRLFALFGAMLFFALTVFVLSGATRSLDLLTIGDEDFSYLRFLLWPASVWLSPLLLLGIAYLWRKRGWPYKGLLLGFICLASVEFILKVLFPDTALTIPNDHIFSLELGFYPSGHAGRAMYLALGLAALLKRPWRLLPLVYPLVVSKLMFIQGYHYLTDLLGGLLLGGSLILLLLSLRDFRKDPEP